MIGKTLLHKDAHAIITSAKPSAIYTLYSEYDSVAADMLLNVLECGNLHIHLGRNPEAFMEKVGPHLRMLMALMDPERSAQKVAAAQEDATGPPDCTCKT